MKIQQSITDKVTSAYSPAHYEVLNESHMHSVPPNSETHFKLTLVSNEFAGMMKVRRHQAIYQLLADELAGEVHALALHLFTEDEWQQRQQQSPDSPNCLGGSKADK